MQLSWTLDSTSSPSRRWWQSVRSFGASARRQPRTNLIGRSLPMIQWLNKNRCDANGRPIAPIHQPGRYVSTNTRSSLCPRHGHRFQNLVRCVRVDYLYRASKAPSKVVVGGCWRLRTRCLFEAWQRFPLKLLAGRMHHGEVPTHGEFTICNRSLRREMFSTACLFVRKYAPLAHGTY